MGRLARRVLREPQLPPAPLNVKEKRMYRTASRWALAAGLCALAGAAAAQTPQQNFRFGLMAGITGGGDTLATVDFTNGDSENLKAGGLFNIAAGVVWQPAQIPFGGHLMAGYHVDDITADNGTLRFSRYPIEVMGFWNGAPPLRLGVGARFVTSPKVVIDIDGSTNTTVSYKDTIGTVLEVGYQPTPRFWVSLRGTFEEYEAKTQNLLGATIVPTGKVSGNSIGLYVGASF
jgi:hypothetical protein